MLLASFTDSIRFQVLVIDAVPGNFVALRRCLPWERFRSIIARCLPLPRILHPEPEVRFDAEYPREEPYALKCARTDLCRGASTVFDLSN